MKKIRGRPVGSNVRQNIIEILFFKGKAYGYDLYKDYVALFPGVTMRLIYYHLKKGIALGEFAIDKVAIEKGDYSWGGEVEKIYYKLGPKAISKLDKRVKAFFEKRSEKK